MAKGELTWEEFDRIEGGFIGTDTPHLAAIQNKRHALAQSEVFSWNQPDQQAQLEAIRNDGGVTPDNNEDLFMQAGIGTLGTIGTGRSQRAVQTNKSSAGTGDRATKQQFNQNKQSTITKDGNLSVTHGLSSSAKKELDGIRGFLAENKANQNQQPATPSTCLVPSPFN